MLWLVMHDADTQQSDKVSSVVRVTFLERWLEEPGYKNSLDMAANEKGPRTLFSHLPYDLIAPKVSWRS